MPPDLEDTRNKVCAGSIDSVTACTQAGTVESSTMSSGPAGCAPSNALFQWEKMRTQGDSTFQAAAASVFALTQFEGADFLLYGPMRFAPWVYPACAAVDALIAYGGRFRGVRPASREHPLYKIF